MKAFLSLLLISLLIGCVTIRSNVKSGAVPKFKRILVVTKLYSPPRNYELRYLTIFPKEYEVCVVGLTPISFDPDSLIDAKLKQCKSDVILTLELKQEGISNVNQVGGVVYNNSTPSEYLAEMKSVATGQPFWKAQLSGSVAGSIPPRMMVKRLIEDGILVGRMPTYNQK